LNPLCPGIRLSHFEPIDQKMSGASDVHGSRDFGGTFSASGSAAMLRPSSAFFSDAEQFSLGAGVVEVCSLGQPAPEVLPASFLPGYPCVSQCKR